MKYVINFEVCFVGYLYIVDGKSTLQHRDLLVYQLGLLGYTFSESVYFGTHNSIVCFINFSQNLFKQKG